MSSKPYAGVICDHCGFVDIDEQEYNRQMRKPHQLWLCPNCTAGAQFDDKRFEELQEMERNHD